MNEGKEAIEVNVSLVISIYYRDVAMDYCARKKVTEPICMRDGFAPKFLLEVGVEHEYNGASKMILD